ncbi:hypothetical protein FRB99_002366 [Tulasnella sp. 403]|nr:hypothetical protein FRB99_002366 [Tulasnella sp. 403]
MLISVKKIAPALAAGNSVIVKPSELAPISVLELAEMAREAGIPPEVLTILPGGAEVAKTLVADPLVKKVDVTAGTATGKAIGSVVGHNLASFTAELGGKAPILVFQDADLESAVNGVMFSAFVASGQTCVSGTRLLVDEGIYDIFLDILLGRTKRLTDRIGNPTNPKSVMGPVISAKSLARIEGMCARITEGSGGIIVQGGKRMTGMSSLDGFDFSKGSFFPPTLVTHEDHKDELFQEEVFGPVVSIMKFVDEKHAIELANSSRYGLGAGIWTSDVARAHRVASKIEAGICWVNTHHRNDPSSPWGGMKESGIGRENGVEALESLIINTATVEETRENDNWFAEDGAERSSPYTDKMRFSVVYALSLVASSLAISVTSPKDGAIWNINGPNTVSWSSVSTDPTAFRIVLVDPTYKVQQELAANVPTSSGSVVVQPPSGGWPTGSKFQVNLMGTANDNPSGILAQSGSFTIGTPSSSLASTTSASLSVSQVIPTTLSGMSTSQAIAGNPATATGQPTGTSATDLNPTGTGNGAVGLFKVSTTLLGLVAVAHAFIL